MFLRKRIDPPSPKNIKTEKTQVIKQIMNDRTDFILCHLIHNGKRKIYRKISRSDNNNIFFHYSSPLEKVTNYNYPIPTNGLFKLANCFSTIREYLYKRAFEAG